MKSSEKPINKICNDYFSAITNILSLIHFFCLIFSGEHVMCPSQGHSGSSATGHVSDPGGPALGSGHGPGIRTDLHPRPPQQVVYVFTTSLANRSV